MRRLCLGIMKLTPGWKILLDQIGADTELIDFSEDLITSYSALIINSSPDMEQSRALKNFRDQSGAILETADASFCFKKKTSKKTAYLINHSDSEIFRQTSFIDLNCTCHFISGGRYFRGLIHFSEQEDHTACFFGIDPDAVLNSDRYKRRRFYFSEQKYPDEIVSAADRGAVKEVLHSCLIELHFRQELPFVSKWISPEQRPYFAFRIDSDYGDRASVKALQELSVRAQIPFTWFLHVQAHEDWLDDFRANVHDEIALHGYEHGTSRSFEHIFNNIERGLQLLQDAGYSPNGFCAPYGIWDQTLAEVLKKFNFNYTSEFTQGYDSLPFRPLSDGELFPSFQIPIHPICTGSLNRRAATEHQMKAYFLEVLRRSVGLHQPVIFYHHPLQPGLAIWDSVFTEAKEQGLVPLTFSEIAEFWDKRNESELKVSLDSQKRIIVQKKPAGLNLQISTDHRSFALTSDAGKIDTDSMDLFHYSYPNPIDATQIHAMRGHKMKLLKTNLLDWRNRNQL